MKIIILLRLLFAVPLVTGAATVAAATLRGTVTRASDGMPLVDVTVTASRRWFPFGMLQHRSTQTNALGEYSIDGMPAATYYVNADAVGSDLVRQLYPGGVCPPAFCDNAVTGPGVVPLELSETQQIDGIDFALVQGGAISGQVLRADTSAPLAGVNVTLMPLGWEVETDSSGLFHFTRVPAGIRQLRARGRDDLVSALYPDVACEFAACATDNAVATQITLAAGSALTRDIRMPVGARIAGVLQPASAAADHSVLFTLMYDGSTATIYRMVDIGADGSYQIEGLASGEYRLAVTSNLFRSQVYPDEICATNCLVELPFATAVATKLGSLTDNVDFSLTAAGRIEGRVSDSGTGLPLAGVELFAYKWIAAAPPHFQPGAVVISQTLSAADGSYRLEGIAPQSVRVATRNELGYLDERYDNQPCTGFAGCMGTDAGSIWALNWEEVMPADFALDPGASIFGRVQLPGTNYFPWSPVVQVFDLQGQFITGVLPKSDGSFQTTGIAPGQYRVRAVVLQTGQILYGQVYGGMSCSYVPTEQCDIGSGRILDLGAGVPVEANIAIEPVFVGNFE